MEPHPQKQIDNHEYEIGQMSPAATVTIEGLKSAIAYHQSQEAKFTDKVQRHNTKLEKIRAAQATAEQSHRSVNKKIVSRSVTDPNPERAAETEKTESRRPQQSFWQHRHKKMADRLIANIDHTVESEPVSAKGLIARISEVASERRRLKQQVRQDRTKRAEAIFGAGIGLGKKDSVKTWSTKIKTMGKTVSSYSKGEIGVREFVKGIQKAHHHVEYDQTRALKRETRKERNSAAIADLLARQPVRKAVRKRHANRRINRAERLEYKTQQARQRRQQLELELQKLSHPDKS